MRAREQQGAWGSRPSVRCGPGCRPGVDVVLDIVGFDALLADAVLVVTGEGSLDEQSLGGKAPVGVLRAAQAQGVPTIVVAGRSTLTPEVLSRTGFEAVYTLQDREPDLTTCIREAPGCCARSVARSRSSPASDRAQRLASPARDVT